MLSLECFRAFWTPAQEWENPQSPNLLRTSFTTTEECSLFLRSLNHGMCVYSEELCWLLLAGAYFFASTTLPILVSWCWGFQKYTLVPSGGFNWTSSRIDCWCVPTKLLVVLAGQARLEPLSNGSGLPFSHYNPIQLSVILCRGSTKQAQKHNLQKLR